MAILGRSSCDVRCKHWGRWELLRTVDRGVETRALKAHVLKIKFVYCRTSRRDVPPSSKLVGRTVGGNGPKDRRYSFGGGRR